MTSLFLDLDQPGRSRVLELESWLPVGKVGHYRFFSDAKMQYNCLRNMAIIFILPFDLTGDRSWT